MSLRSMRLTQRARRGATAVEFALVVPIFLMLILGFMTLLTATFMESFVEDAAFRAARTLVVPGASVAEGTTIANEQLAIGGVGSAQVAIQPYTGTTATSGIEEATDRVVVNVTMTFDHGMQSVLPPLQIQRSASMRTERP